MTTDILLVRHAAHVELGRILSGRRPDVALSDEGLGQASMLADRLKAEPLAAVYSSPRERARYTASAIAERHELSVDVEGALDEIDFGEWAGCSFAELEGDPLWRHWNAARSCGRAPGGETMAEATARAAAAIEAVAAVHPDRSVAVVTHCDIIRGVIAHYLGLSSDNVLRFDIAPGSVSRLAVGHEYAQLISLNEKSGH